MSSDSGTSGTCKGIETTSKAYKLLFRNAEDSENCQYWLANSCVSTLAKSSTFYIRLVAGGSVSAKLFWESDEEGMNVSDGTMGVRAVVSL